MSEVKVNKISPRSGTTVTLGDSGDTFTIPSGATINNQGTATNFGATGSASWVTTVKTSTFTAVAGEGYFINTTGGVVTVNLPAGTAGAVVAVKDYAGTFDTNAVTLVQNGSDKIGGSTDNVTLITEGIAVTLVFIDSTQGWLVTDSGLQSEAPQATYVVGTGGTITTSGNFKIHTFTGPGTFTVCSVGNPFGSNTVDYLVVAGGASGGGQIAGGGGAGGARMSSGAASGCYTASPLGGSVSALPVSAQGYPIVVGGGGAPVAETGSDHFRGNPGNTSSFSTISSAGGGGGGGNNVSTDNGLSGGSGGGGGLRQPAPGGAGNTPPVSPPQGNPGGTLSNPNTDGGAGGGGATAAGANSTGSAPGSTAGIGGAGVTNAIRAACQSYAGGGGGGGRTDDGVGGGPASAGGGRGAPYPGGPDVRTGEAGTANTGGGGGGGGYNGSPLQGVSGQGGSGIVIIRYKFQ